MNIFISHKLEDSDIAKDIADVLKHIGVGYYLDVLDDFIVKDGENLTNHIREELNDCTDLIVVMSSITKFSQWVPFEIGMASQAYMPTASYLSEHVSLPEFLEFWPRLKTPSDILRYIETKRKTFRDSIERRGPVLENWSITNRKNDLKRFYGELKRVL